MKTRIGRIGAVLAVGVAVLAGLILASFALPIPLWRTGELPAPPMALIPGGPELAMPRRLWVDTDAACGHGRTTDPDDCFALLLLARAPGVEIAGISTVHGNAAIEVTERTTRELAALLEREGASAGGVHRGASALREALEKGPLTLVALGPLTNIAAALAHSPDLRRNVARLVAVMGRTPGHLFHPGEGAQGGMLFGHGPVFRDFNFDQDSDAAARVLAMNLPMTLVPYVAARQVSLTGEDLAVLEADGGAAAWVAWRARPWLSFWRQDIGKPGFYPFDVLAAAYVLRPGLFSCARTSAVVAKDKKLWGWIYGPEGVLVGIDATERPDARAAGSVLYCPEVAAAAHDWIVAGLAGAQ